MFRSHNEFACARQNALYKPNAALPVLIFLTWKENWYAIPKRMVKVGGLLALTLFGLTLVSLSAATDQDKPTYETLGKEATLAGTMFFIGTPPEQKRIDMSADRFCETVNCDPCI